MKNIDKFEQFNEAAKVENIDNGNVVKIRITSDGDQPIDVIKEPYGVSIIQKDSDRSSRNYITVSTDAIEALCKALQDSLKGE